MRDLAGPPRKAPSHCKETPQMVRSFRIGLSVLALALCTILWAQGPSLDSVAPPKAPPEPAPKTGEPVKTKPTPAAKGGEAIKAMPTPVATQPGDRLITVQEPN